MRHPIDPLLPNSRMQAMKRMLDYAEHGAPPSLAQRLLDWWQRRPYTSHASAHGCAYVITQVDAAAAAAIAKDATREVTEMGGRDGI